MEGFLLKLGTMSIQAAVIILVICAIRALMIKVRVSQKYIMLLWLIPFFFMVFPWKISSPVGFWSAESVVEQYRDEVYQQSNMQEEVQNTVQSQEQSQQMVNQIEVQKPVAQINSAVIENTYSVRERIMLAVFMVWLVGVAGVLCYMLVSTLKLRKNLICSICEQDNIYRAEDIVLPMVFGVIRPRIYLPISMNAEHISYVLAHEQTHIMRRDPLKKLLAFLIVGVHWFNPLAWVAFRLLECDMEMACDEETVKRLGEESKKAYASTLLWISSGRNAKGYRLGVPLAFGEVDTKQRIKNILINKKTMQVVAIAVILVCIALTAVFLTKQETEVTADKSTEEMTQVEDSLNEESSVIATLVPQPVNIVEAVVTEEIGYGYGSDEMMLEYADEERMICRDYFGLYVYDVKAQKILRQIALESIGCNYTQGDMYCDVRVSADGSRVYLHQGMTEEMYVYDIDEDSLWKQTYDFENISFFEDVLSRDDYVEKDHTSYQSSGCVQIGESSYGYLLSGSGMVVDTAWVIRDLKGMETSSYLFRENEERPRLQEQVEPEVREFTMDMLIAICNGGNIKEVFQGLVEEDSLCYSNFSKDQMGNSLTWAYFCEMSYKEKQYRMQVSYWKPETAADYGKAANGLDDIYLREMASDDGLMLYRAESGYRAGKADIMEFLERRYDIGEYMTLELPENITLGDYRVYNNDIFSGCLMYGDYPETVHGEWCPEAWYALGGIGIVETWYHSILAFENGRLSQVEWLMNHSEIEREGEYIAGCDMQAMLCEASFDVFTLPEWEEYKEKYPDASEELMWSKYWYVFFGEPDSEMIYTVYLNQEHFTKEDAIALAKSVRFVKR